jgi:hypothetical protein
VSSDTPQVVCLHDFGDSGPSQAPDQAKHSPQTPNMPTNCGSPARGMPCPSPECSPRRQSLSQLGVGVHDCPMHRGRQVAAPQGRSGLVRRGRLDQVGRIGQRSDSGQCVLPDAPGQCRHIGEVTSDIRSEDVLVAGMPEAGGQCVQLIVRSSVLPRQLFLGPDLGRRIGRRSLGLQPFQVARHGAILIERDVQLG